jgi:hypothetical protein
MTHLMSTAEMNHALCKIAKSWHQTAFSIFIISSSLHYSHKTYCFSKTINLYQTYIFHINDRLIHYKTRQVFIKCFKIHEISLFLSNRPKYYWLVSGHALRSSTYFLLIFKASRRRERKKPAPARPTPTSPMSGSWSTLWHVREDVRITRQQRHCPRSTNVITKHPCTLYWYVTRRPGRNPADALQSVRLMALAPPSLFLLAGDTYFSRRVVTSW